MYEVIFYSDKRGKCPTEEFLDKLRPKIRAKVEKWIEKLEEEGSGRIVITHGFVKKTEKLPVGEIEKAERIMQDFLQRYLGGEIEL